MSKTFKLQIVAPDRPALSAEPTTVVLPGEEGEFGVQAGHMALLASLRPGTLRVLKEDGKELYYVAGGFAEVDGDSLTVLAEEYENAGEIDGTAAREDRDRALRMLSEKKEGTDLKAQAHALARAQARLKALEESVHLGK
jgi:F-type H+-transporting ATPase subunit epsilon